MSVPTQLPNRQVMKAQEEAEAQLYLRSFDPKRYSHYYRRIYEPTAYLDEVGVEKICELIEHGNGVLNVAEALDISGSTLRKWITSDNTRVAKVNLAYTFAGDAYAFKAGLVLQQSQYHTKEGMLWASKMAEHYRWMASKLNRERFGETKEDPTESKKAPMVININTTGTHATAAIEGEYKRVSNEPVNVEDILTLMNHK